MTIPRVSETADCGAELGVVIGRETLHVSEADALSCVAGYCVINDVSERSFQAERGGQWIKGKSAPGFGPIGSWLVTADEVLDPQALSLSPSLNAETMQNSCTSGMIFGVAQIVSYMSNSMKLMPGDAIATGTPEGVGLGMNPQRFLRPGDVMELTVEELGTPAAGGRRGRLTGRVRAHRGRAAILSARPPRHCRCERAHPRCFCAAECCGGAPQALPSFRPRRSGSTYPAWR